jgi:Mg2+ and Co2+ transporter CorA
MAQKDAKVNIALAENSTAITKASKEDSAIMRTIALETKKDSSSMKTISLLGIIFLPGTFVAVSFKTRPTHSLSSLATIHS